MAESNSAAKVGKVNIGENMELAARYSIAAVPTIIMFKAGEIVEKTQGFQDQANLQSLIDAHV